MQGQSLAWLRQQGVHVQLAEDERPFRALNRAFWINQQEGRPYITLKWAETANGIMGHSQGARLHITGAASNRLVHWLRAEHPAIMIGRATAQRDQPSLSTRYYPGPSPTRVVWDPELRLPATLPLFRQPGRSLLLNRHRAGEADGLTYYIPAQGSFGAVDSLMRELYTQFGIGSVLVEGGRRLLQQFLDHHCWDAIYRFRGLSNAAGDVSAPVIHQGFQPYQTHLLNSDILQIYYHYETGTIQHSSAEAYH
jgi:diaminohydroxyphosphoribosylaminopyrimidine deaminase/5-amino-6-(5-phosphoribosylamino)uracil reductase